MISSNNLIDKREQRFRSLALLTVSIIYLLILAGGIVRGTGSGMGCPDWPKCFGRWIPPTEASQLPPNYQQIYGAKLKGEVEFNAVKTWIEYTNRLLGVLSGFFVFATLLASLTYLHRDRAIFWASAAAFLLIGANGWLGSKVVATELAQYMITLHLLLAILVVFALLFVLIRSNADRLQSSLIGENSSALKRILFVTIILSLGQILLGTQVRDALDEAVKQLGYQQRNSWIGSLDWRFYVHRSFSLVILFFHIILIYQSNRTAKQGLIKQLTKGLIALVGAEIATGAIMGYFAVPAAAQPIHLLLAVLMIGVQFVILLLVNPKLILLNPAIIQSRLQKV
ncbi:COX15/CtaA family protein [Spirosoma taeanense]|uniref:COX15/CtaA family protein n=1 Tax=Spirosoma taeanense TaxID=2735870 RepID=A0A6M5YCQ1_9BACT|nr:COX15/CtaA family protein [Spirosoma taeanense]QJW91855.1 COX15/CtaA family protein [Spirosoma taeanense]